MSAGMAASSAPGGTSSVREAMRPAPAPLKAPARSHLHSHCQDQHLYRAPHHAQIRRQARLKILDTNAHEALPAMVNGAYPPVAGQLSVCEQHVLAALGMTGHGAGQRRPHLGAHAGQAPAPRQIPLLPPIPRPAHTCRSAGRSLLPAPGLTPPPWHTCAQDTTRMSTHVIP